MSEIVMTLEEFESLLRKYKFSFDEMSLRKVYAYFIEQNISSLDIKNIIKGAKKYKILTNETDNKVTFELKEYISKFCNRADIDTFRRLNLIDNEFKRVYRTRKLKPNPQLDDCIKVCFERAKKWTEDGTEFTREISSETLDHLYNLACIYRSLAVYLPYETYKEYPRVVDYIMSQKILKCDAQIDSTTATELDAILKLLTTHDESISADEVFSSDDLRDLLKGTASIVWSTNKSKVEAVRAVLGSYVQHIKDMAYLEDKEELTEDLTVKSIILRAGTILNITENNITKAVDFLSGKPVGEILKDLTDTQVYSVSDRKNFLFKKYFPNLKITMSLENHIDFLKNTPSTFGRLTFNSLYDTTTALVDLFAMAYNIDINNEVDVKKERLLELGVDFDTIYTGDNLSNIFNVNQHLKRTEMDGIKEVVVTNIITLKDFITPTSISDIVRHNFNLLLQDPAFVKISIQSIFDKAKGNAKVLQDLLDNFANAEYTVNFGANNIVAEPAGLGDKELPKTDNVERLHIDIEILSDDVEVEDEISEFQLDDLKYNSLLVELYELQNYKNADASTEIADYLCKLSGLVGVHQDIDDRDHFNTIINQFKNRCKTVINNENITQEKLVELQEIFQSTITMLQMRITSLREFIELNVEEYDEFYKKERTRKASKESSYSYSLLVKKAKDLAKNSLAKKFNMVPQDALEEAELQRDIELEEEQEFTSERDKAKAALIDYQNSSREIYCVESIIKFIEQASKSIDKKLSIISETDRQDELRYESTLHQIELKRQERERIVDLVKHKYPKFANDITKITTSFGRRLLARIEKIDKEIEKLESSLNSGITV